jgi:hypothetical protein
LTELVIDGATLQAVLAGQSTLHIRFTVPGEGSAPGGFALYGERLGCYPVEPTLFLLS